MLPTPSTSHVDYGRIYEPAEDSFLFLDTLSSAAETAFLSSRFGSDDDAAPAPLVVEIGTGSGVVIAFVAAQSRRILGTHCALTAGVDVNAFACAATAETVRLATDEGGSAAAALYLGSTRADLTSALRPGSVDVLLFNPPYVPTPDAPPRLEEQEEEEVMDGFARDSYLLELSYAGGRDGMETTDRLIDQLPAVLSPRGCAYVLLCKQNRPDEVRARILRFGPQWRVVKAGDSGKQAGWEKLQIIRIWREVGIE
ncbi:hypothetical protein MAPG_06361 [Magnaporthiopsis poae ATCC 64411]|uniref:N(5)-glutamine methyltransferase MTQ2 n=1 Tax=Magnaporthiopsis poae (strain ATCC 64411 / 73-15) TaxID=644358 RepID=A0A0C4E1U0_MAGP6|nr:hypothetical protein MAPG_06361 [Magnaporthiopsis poae ATCC 64411]